MKFGFKEIPYEASLFFLAWIVIIIFISDFIVCIVFPVNTSSQKLSATVQHGIFVIIYLLPTVCVGLKVWQNRKLAGLPLLICAVIIWIEGMTVYLNMFAGMNVAVPGNPEHREVIRMILLTVAVPLSFCLFARSAGCRECWNMKLLEAFAVSCYFLTTAAYLTGLSSSVLGPESIILYLLFLSPISGVLYIQMMMAIHREKKDFCSRIKNRERRGQGAGNVSGNV